MTGTKSICFILGFSMTSCSLLFYKRPISVNDISDKVQIIESNFKSDDTIVLFRNGCSGCISGIEKDLYVFRKINNITEIERISNFRRYKKIEIKSSTFLWDSILSNFNSYVTDQIVTEKIVSPASENSGYSIMKYGYSHGPTFYLNLNIGEKKHRVYFEPGIRDANERNTNVQLIGKLEILIKNVIWKPTNRIKYEYERK